MLTTQNTKVDKMSTQKTQKVATQNTKVDKMSTQKHVKTESKK
jgi:hypothetical protein